MLSTGAIKYLSVSSDRSPQARGAFLITLGHSDESYFDSIAKPPGDTIIIDPNDGARGEL